MYLFGGMLYKVCYLYLAYTKNNKLKVQVYLAHDKHSTDDSVLIVAYI